MKLVKGQLVFSRRGRDNGRVYMVLGTEHDRVLLANGTTRTLVAPKRKNIRHINATGTVLQAGQYSNDTQLKGAIAAYEAAIRPETSGGKKLV